ncbi:MAG: Orotate phosphoribosyltransferase [Hyphomonas sp. BRH_c22]|uniref:orotate phosphoribosyltransferase n=1 Tax=Hyphomonas sp. BRH_c22 TaxID=1629710 RepID=UPI0005F18321|nr:orotate phosphoribosyltransferase [Hyphomonas sp. BRH_c22]KJS35596.1 MAG: Orotate phosphoribosyltransferase [Hyphomonas sp. BRH_c22]KJS39197.1 MAG: Orotate phosphoribosyltransferase [Hyphomonas sp. BRH_c22]
MTNEDVLAVFREAGALLEGHFILSSGRRSPVFLQKALVFSQPELSERLCKALAEKLTARFGRIDVVAGPAVGGIIPGYELARHLKARAIFAERVDGKLQFRRGFAIAEGEKVLIAEDIVTTGLSFRETVEALDRLPGEVVGGACIIDRSNGKADVGCELVSLAAVDFPDYDANDLPPELAAMEAVKPGSRGLA